MVIDAFGQSEIEQLHGTRRRHLDVGRLQIAMNDPLPMRHLQGVCDLDRDRDGILDGERTLQQPLGECRSVDQFKYQGGHSVDALEAIDGADVRMVEGRENLCFALEADQTVRVLGEEQREDLDRNVAIELAVARAVHIAHPATAKEVHDRIRAELPADERRSLLCCSHRRNRRPAFSVVAPSARKKAVCLAVRGEQRSHLFAHVHVISAFARDVRVALRLRQRHRGIEHGKHTIQVFAGHPQVLPFDGSRTTISG